MNLCMRPNHTYAHLHTLTLNLTTGLDRVNKIMSLILVHHFFETECASNAAYSQLQLFEDLTIFRKFDEPLANAVIYRLQAHLWYSSPEFIPFALASPNVPDVEKQKLATAILEQPRNQLRPGIVKMNPLKPGVTLASRVSEQTPYFFSALGVGFGFLAEPVSNWPEIPAFLKFRSFVQSFPLTNDHTERVIKRTSDYINQGSKGEDDLQALLNAVEAAVARVPDRGTKTALIASYDQDDLFM